MTPATLKSLTPDPLREHPIPNRQTGRLARKLLVVGWTLAATSAASAADYVAARGEPHFEFVLPRIDSREAVSLAQFRGQRLLLIHFASW